MLYCIRIIMCSRDMIMPDIQLLYRDRYLVVCEKPVGIPSESPGLPDLVGAGLHTKCYPVHRLDQGTGGVAVLALSAGSCEAMRNLFTAGLVRKEYLAVIENSPPESSGEYTDLLFHDSRKNKSFVVSRNRKGVRDALCSWNVMESIHDNDRILTLVHITLHTGRTHQIRVQFASRGYPLAGDRKYGSRVKADTVCLWASGISFPHPLERHGHIVSAMSMPPALFPWNRFGPLTYSPEDG